VDGNPLRVKGHEFEFTNRPFSIFPFIDTSSSQEHVSLQEIERLAIGSSQPTKVLVSGDFCGDQGSRDTCCALCRVLGIFHTIHYSTSDGIELILYTMCMCAESATVSGGQSKKTALNLCPVYHAFYSSLKYKNAIGYPFKVNPPSLIDEGGTLPPYH